jgi:hypothetical protein
MRAFINCIAVKKLLVRKPLALTIKRYALAFYFFKIKLKNSSRRKRPRPLLLTEKVILFASIPSLSSLYLTYSINLIFFRLAKRNPFALAKHPTTPKGQKGADEVNINQFFQ